LNFPELTVEEIQFKIKTIDTKYAAGIAKAMKKGDADLHDVPKNKHIHSCWAVVFHEPECLSTMALFSNMFLHLFAIQSQTTLIPKRTSSVSANIQF
jgi:hypothetical protein